MKPSPSIYSLLLASIAKATGDEPKAIEFSLRSKRILEHYAKEIDLKRMDIISATERAIRDIAGDNYGTARQRSGLGNETKSSIGAKLDAIELILNLEFRP